MLQRQKGRSHGSREQARRKGEGVRSLMLCGPHNRQLTIMLKPTVQHWMIASVLFFYFFVPSTKESPEPQQWLNKGDNSPSSCVSHSCWPVYWAVWLLSTGPSRGCTLLWTCGSCRHRDYIMRQYCVWTNALSLLIVCVCVCSRILECSEKRSNDYKKLACWMVEWLCSVLPSLESVCVPVRAAMQVHSSLLSNTVMTQLITWCPVNLRLTWYLCQAALAV